MSQTFYNARFRGAPAQGDTNGTHTGPVIVPTYTVATAPANDPAGSVAYISNGAGGQPILAFSNGTAYRRSDTGGALADE